MAAEAAAAAEPAAAAAAVAAVAVLAVVEPVAVAQAVVARVREAQALVEQERGQEQEQEQEPEQEREQVPEQEQVQEQEQVRGRAGAGAGSPGGGGGYYAVEYPYARGYGSYYPNPFGTRVFQIQRSRQSWIGGSWFGRRAVYRFHQHAPQLGRDVRRHATQLRDVQRSHKPQGINEALRKTPDAAEARDAPARRSAVSQAAGEKRLAEVARSSAEDVA